MPIPSTTPMPAITPPADPMYDARRRPPEGENLNPPVDENRNKARPPLEPGKNLPPGKPSKLQTDRDDLER